MESKSWSREGQHQSRGRGRGGGGRGRGYSGGSHKSRGGYYKNDRRSEDKRYEDSYERRFGWKFLKRCRNESRSNGSQNNYKDEYREPQSSYGREYQEAG